tara:strand:- start:695 stop:2155 length:1461 start_codon:yes stop_codon:yes gene_type:complete
MGVIRKQSIRNSIIFYLGMSIGAINTVLIYPNVFNDQPEHWGLIQLIVAYALVLSTFTSFGIPKVLLKFFPVYRDKSKLLMYSMLIPSIGLLFVTLLYIFLKNEIFLAFKMDPLLQENFMYVLILIFCISFYEIFSALSRSYLDAITPVVLNEFFLKTYTLIILVLHGFKYIDFSTFLLLYVSGYLIKLFVLSLINFLNKRVSISFKLSDLNFDELFKFGLYVFAGGLSIMIVTRLDMLMIGYLLDLEQVAFYTLAFYIGNAIAIPGRSVISISVPLISKAWENQDIKEIDMIYSKSAINQLIVSGLLFLVVWLNIDDVLSLLPEKFSYGKWVVFYIGLAQLVNMSCGVNGAIIVNSKYYKYDLYTNLILLAITVLLNFLLIPIFGINGAAMATAFSIIFFNLIRLIIIYNKIQIQPFTLKTLLTIILLILVYLICFKLDFDNIFLSIAVKTILSATLFISICVKANLSDDINKLISDIYLRIFKK